MADLGDERGAWIEHDGGPCPTHLLRYGLVYEIEYDLEGGTFASSIVRTSSPEWLWRWKKVRVGWFRKEWRRVCDTPGFAAIVKFRPIYPKGFQIIKGIAEAPETITVPPDTPAEPAHT